MKVAPGQPQPITTRYGLTYAIPADWTNKHQMSAGWSGEDGHAAYGTVGFFGYGFCPSEEGGWLAISGASGARDPDLEAVALDKVRAVEWIFDDNAGTLPTVEYDEPVWFEIAGRPAVRISASVSDTPKIGACEPEAAQFDIVATFEELPLELEREARRSKLVEIHRLVVAVHAPIMPLQVTVVLRVGIVDQLLHSFRLLLASFVAELQPPYERRIYRVGEAGEHDHTEDDLPIVDDEAKDEQGGKESEQFLQCAPLW